MSFDPISLLLMAGAGISAFGALREGKAASQAANYQAAVSNQNAKIAEENAVDAIQRAQVDQLSLDNESAAFRGSQLAAQGASGLAIGGRSQALTRAASDRLAREDALKIRQGGDFEARRFKQEAANFRNEATASKMEAKNARISSYFDAAATLIGAAKPTGSSLSTRPKVASSGSASGRFGVSSRASGSLGFFS